MEKSLEEEIIERASNGIARAQHALGLMHFYGLGAEKNGAESSKWLRLSQATAKPKFPVGLVFLGDIYRYGMNVNKDLVEALKLYKEAAGLGVVEAQSRLGELYLNGEDVPQNIDEAKVWLEKAALSDHARSQSLLGSIYKQSMDPQERRKATKWFQSAAELGDMQARFEVAELLSKGESVKLDKLTALISYRIAAASGHELARVRVRELEAELELSGTKSNSVTLSLNLGARVVTMNIELGFLYAELKRMVRNALAIGTDDILPRIQYRDEFHEMVDLESEMDWQECCKTRKGSEISLTCIEPAVVASDDLFLSIKVHHGLQRLSHPETGQEGWVLGEGTFGRVELMKEVGIDSRVAVKFLNQLDAESTQRALEEYRLHTKLSHPNVLQCYRAFLESHPAQVCIVLEYCSVGDLYRFLSKMKLGSVDNKPHVRVDMCRQLAYALSYVHSIPITHPDIHPGNVLVQPGPTLKLSDFGLAEDVTLDSVRSVVGVPDFMAPEVIGESYGPPADIFSLGVVFICIITLDPKMRELFERPPWSAVADSEVRFLNRVSQLLTEADLLNLFPILERMLRHNAEERCSAEQVADFFDTLLKAQ